MRWSRLWDILDPSCTIKLWTTDGSTWSSGRFKSFWRKKKAFELAEQWKNSYNFVTVMNELTGETTKIKEDKRTPIMDYHSGMIVGLMGEEE